MRDIHIYYIYMCSIHSYMATGAPRVHFVCAKDDTNRRRAKQSEVSPKVIGFHVVFLLFFYWYRWMRGNGRHDYRHDWRCGSRQPRHSLKKIYDTKSRIVWWCCFAASYAYVEISTQIAITGDAFTMGPCLFSDNLRNFVVCHML